ncbi:hypothetical protein [Nocardioides sp. Arc9.136]|uniref:hypothetical protein n=1 Tax=Nocardioides sp. Arc9.136 TaxID=2996826 RepID=UPI002666A53F|nr:hypothetical protein [Nocardioides sp. Arc9.136]WKN46625.1 hypothetical protein OSR43_11240 [Nocardioides sp. Arc9.136]
MPRHPSHTPRTATTRNGRPGRPQRHGRLGLAALATATTLLSAGCADSGDDGAPEASASASGPSASAAPTPGGGTAASTRTPAAEPTEPAGPVLDVRVRGANIEPNGASLDLAVGETLTLAFDADRSGELHVHSRPEQVIPFQAGTSTVELAVDNPGAVDIEEHDTGIVIAQLEVR